MNVFSRRAIASLLFVASLNALPNIAAADDTDDQINQRPSALAMVGDAVFARPLLFAGTLVGTTAFVASLPFSALGGNVEEVAKILVVGPAKSTFTRCLGCTATQDAWKNRTINDN